MNPQEVLDFIQELIDHDIEIDVQEEIDFDWEGDNLKRTNYFVKLSYSADWFYNHNNCVGMRFKKVDNDKKK